MNLRRSIIGGLAGVAVLIAAFGLPPVSGDSTADYLRPEHRGDFRSEINRHPNGVYEVSALTAFPGATPDMVAWWFGDYLQTTEHYQRWHPQAHVWMDWEKKVPGEYVGAAHLVHEYLGEDLEKLRIQFVDPAEILGADALADGDVAVCARVGLLERPINGAKMCHIVRRTDGGAEMLSRFWLGHVAKRDGNDIVPSIEGLLGNRYLIRMIGVRRQDALDLMRHAEEEMGYLAEFLPELYAQETARSETE